MLLLQGSPGILTQYTKYFRDQLYVPKLPGMMLLLLLLLLLFIVVPGKGWVLCDICGLLEHLGRGLGVLSQNRRLQRSWA